MSEPAESLHIAMLIRCAPDEAYAFIRDPRNLPQWATGLGGAVEQINDEWVVESSMGRLTLRFAPENPFGVVDHDVTLPDGDTTSNPMRVLAHHSGCEVVFSLQRGADVSDAAFEADAAAIRADLTTLRTLLESGRGGQSARPDTR
jgi:hypothetical protein